MDPMKIIALLAIQIIFVIKKQVRVNAYAMMDTEMKNLIQNASHVIAPGF